MRKLATVRKVKELKPIPGATMIEVCTMEKIGWQVVVRKGDVKEGDIVVYFEIDSALPSEERYEFLRASSVKKVKTPAGEEREVFRLKTIKLRGTLSQGLVIPISQFPEIKDGKEGMDVTDLLKVEHYDELTAAQESPYAKASKSGVKLSYTPVKHYPFPSFIRKTDQDRIQNNIDYFEKYKDVLFTAEQKYDGSSMTIFYADPKKYKRKEAVGVCSRNFELVYEPLTLKVRFKGTLERLKDKKRPLVKRIKDAIYFLLKFKEPPMNDKFIEGSLMYDVKDALQKFNTVYKRNIALQGELVGPGMNGNKDKYKHMHWYVFDIFDIDKETYMDSDERHKCIDILNSFIEDPNRNLIEVRTLKDKWKVFEDMDTLEKILKYVEQDTSRGNPMEGVVFKSIGHEPYISFKVINNQYLLKQKD